MRWRSPAFVVAVFLVAYVGISLSIHGGDVAEMARLGIRYEAGDRSALEGYDGQYAYFIALDPARAASHLDVPAYRFQRILYPLVARLLSLGQAALIPWVLLVLNLMIQPVGTWIVGELLISYGVSRWYALVYGLWVGFVYAVRLDLTEPMAYGLVAAALLASRRGREGWAALLYALSVFTKETTLLFVASHVAWLACQRDWRGAVRLAGLAIVPFGVFQFFILRWFGRLGLGSGGYWGTPFEIIPYMGLWRISAVNLLALVLFIVIFGPIAVLPSLWGMVTAGRQLWRRDFSLPVLALAVNAGILPFTPFSTFREPLGLLRLIVGLVLTVLLYGAHARSKRVLNYSVLWLACLAFLFNDR